MSAAAALQDPSALFAAQRAAFQAAPDPPLRVRRNRLDRLGAMIDESEDEIISAIAADFGVRSAQETRLAELFMIHVGIRHARRHLAVWMHPRRVATPLYLWPGRSRIVRQPVGVVGVISPWNYPVQLALLPAIAALAAGNRVLLKPSELTPQTSAALARLVGRRFAADEFAVVTGGPDVGEAFSRLPFDHLFFTGSTAVGRRIALAAAANLTPVTLELGGKSPAIIHPDADIGALAPRLATGKLLNAGQTCIAPDYVLAPEERIDALIDALRSSVAALYPRLGANPDYTSIVSDRHYARIAALIADAEDKGARAVRLNPGNELLPERARKLAPTLLVGARDDMAAMREEIFGPVLPIESYRSLDEAIAKVNSRPRPLALYAFGGGVAMRERVLRETFAGGVTFDDTLWHFSNEELPFGGIGASGIGAYHGERGFRTFSHEKAVFTQPRLALAWLLRPPYGARFDFVLRILKRIA
ncbi:MAG TPA: aldehyde dehydrogenase family protein [Casimicrobiaceae bacterium]|nr:aldehyde dehydrogenase family protein [Casimicrobiaceae bacterium]